MFYFVQVFLLIAGALAATCDKITYRKEIHDLSDKEIRIFRETIRKAIETIDTEAPASFGQISIWESAAKV